MSDGKLPRPELQFWVCDPWGIPRFRLDYAWPQFKVGAEYDSDDFHGDEVAVRRDKARLGWLQEMGWLIIPLTVDDVRRYDQAMVARIRGHLAERAA